jgi:hypothetical protein
VYGQSLVRVSPPDLPGGKWHLSGTTREFAVLIPSPCLRRSTTLAALLLCGWTAPQAASATNWGASGPTARPAAQAVPTRAPVAHHGTDGVVPIILGLLLTGAAVYKHRGLPRGH